MISLLSVDEICNKLRPVFGDKIDNIYLQYTLAESRDARDEIEQMLNVLYRKHLHELLNDEAMLEPPKEAVVQGEYPIGMISYAGKDLYDLKLRESDWNRHVCITGMTGSGKTNLAFKIIENFIQKKKPFLVFDWKKSFRPLILADPEILCFTIGNNAISNHFRININKPPKNVNPREWLNVLCDLISECFGVSFGVHKIVSETIDEAFRDSGVYKGSNEYPSWYEIKFRLEDKCKKARGRNATWIESALRIAHVLTFGDFGRVINSKAEDNIPIEDILNKKVLFELSYLSNIEKTFFCRFLLTYIYKDKKANQLGEEKFSQAILVDEAHNIFLKERPNFTNESITDTIYREIREYGIGLICLDQHISKLSTTIVGNSACHFAFQQQLPEDIFLVAKVMNLIKKERYFSSLAVGSAIVKLSERYYNPFLVKVELSPIKNKPVPDEMIRNKMIYFNKQIKAENDSEFMEQLTQLDEIQMQIAREVSRRMEVNEPLDVFFSELENYARENGFKSPMDDIKKVIDFIKEEKVVNLQQEIEHGVVTTEERKVYKEEKVLDSIKDLDEDEKVFLKLLKTKERDYSTTDIYGILRLSARKGTKIKESLVNKGLIEIKDLKTITGRKKIISLKPEINNIYLTNKNTIHQNI